MFATTFTVSILTVSLYRVAHDLHSTPGVIAWVVTGPLLAGAVALPILGRLGDIRGYRTVYLVGFSTAIVFSLLTAAARNPLWLISCRTVAQVAATATIPSSFGMLFRSFPPHERVRASAWSSGTLSASAVIGLAVGGPIVDSIGWRPLFIIQAALAVGAVLPALVVLKPDVEGKRVSLDVPGAVALAVTAFTATFGINRLTATGPSALSITMLAVAPIGAWVLVRIERRSASPLLPISLVRTANVRLSSGCSLLVGAAWTGSFVITPLLLEGLFGMSATLTSLVTVCRTGSIVVAAPIASRLGTRFGEKPVLQGACVVMAGGMVLLAVGSAGLAIWLVVVGLIVSGLAFGNAQPGTITVMANAVTETEFGLATSLQQTTGQIGGVLGLGMLTALAADATRPAPFTTGFLITAGLAVAGAVTASRIRVP
jgi:MFS family permease